MQDAYKGATVFYVGGGPSLKEQDLTLLSSRGITTFAVNQSGAILVKPTLWLGVDLPKSFHQNIWLDSSITKFVPEQHQNCKFFYEDGVPSSREIKYLPNTYFFPLNTCFNHKKFLDEPSVNWGCDAGKVDSIGVKSGRSVLLAAFKIMFYLGFKTIYLLGCDFFMEHHNSYAFDQYKHAGGCASNNKCYDILQKRLEALKPLLEARKVFVYNCTPNSYLEVFQKYNYEDAIYETREFIKDNPDVRNYYGGSNNRFGWS